MTCMLFPFVAFGASKCASLIDFVYFFPCGSPVQH
uniref:Uncharacterized protein n=1 Tax=Arundo donax TaxID=35708 RepID=A0A0A9HI31_ARUDO